MLTGGFEKVLEFKKKEAYQKLINDYLEFENKNYDDKNAIEDYENKSKQDEFALTQFTINGTTYPDEYKIEIIHKMRKAHKNFEDPVTKMITGQLPKITKKYKELKEFELSRNLRPTFDYEYFDLSFFLFVIDLYAEVKAYKKFNKYLLKRKPKLQSRRNHYYIEEPKIMPQITDGILVRYENKKLFINEFYNQLYGRGLINAELHEFEKHFVGSMNIERIKWYGTTPELLYLFELINIANLSIYDVIINHFIDKKNNLFQRQKLYSAREKMSNNQKRIIPILEILKKSE